jgi:hypothetical protein
VTGKVDDSIFDSLRFLEYVDIKEPLGQSELVFDFSERDDEVEKLFFLSDYDLHYIKCALDDDLDCEIGDDADYLLNEHFAEGNTILPDYFYQDNQAKELAKKIYKFFKPNFDFENFSEQQAREVNLILIKMFENELYDFISTQVIFADKASLLAMRKDILENLEKVKQQTGLRWNPFTGEVRIKLSDAFAFLIQSNSSYYNFHDVMSSFFEKADFELRGYNEARYEFFNEDNFDTEEFSKEVLPILEDIYNKINFPRVRESLGVYKFIADNSNYRGELKNPITGASYKIDKIDYENGTISFSEWRTWLGKKYTMTNQEFVDWMTNEKLKLESQDILLSLQQILSDDPRKNRLT